MIKSYFHKYASVLLVTIAAFALCSCSEEELSGFDIPEGYYLDAETIELNVGDFTMEVDETFTLTAEVYPTEVYYSDVVWSSSDTSVATISDGVVTAVGLGTTVITATSVQTESVTAEITITVAEEVIPLESISIYRLSTGEEIESVTVAIYDSVGLGIIYHPANATNTGVMWVMDKAEYASVGRETGVVTGKVFSSGECKVIASSTYDRDITAACTISVEYVDIESIILSYTTTVVDPDTEEVSELILYDAATIGVTQTVAIDVELVPYNATVVSTSWLSDNPLIATVDDEGNVTGQAMGTTTITATSTDIHGNTATKTFEISVDKYIAESITLTSSSLTTRPNETFASDVVVVATPSYGVPDDLIWSVMPEDAATVVENFDIYGGVTATVTPAYNYGGEFTLTATYASDETITASITLSVDEATNVNIAPEFHGAAFPMTDRSVQLTWTYYDTGNGTGTYNDATNITWYSDNTAAATVDANGLVTFVGYGDVKITATSSYDDTVEDVEFSIPAGYFRELYNETKSVNTSFNTNCGYGYYLFNTASLTKGDGYITNTTRTNGGSVSITPDGSTTTYDYYNRSDIYCSDESICVFNGRTYPYFAIHIDDVVAQELGNVQYQAITFSMKTSGGSNYLYFAIDSYDDFADTRVTPYFLDDKSVILAVNIATAGAATFYTPLEASPTSYAEIYNVYIYNNMYGFSGYLSTSAIQYKIYSVQTFATLEDIESYIESEGLSIVEK